MARDDFITVKRWWPDWLEDVARAINALLRHDEETQRMNYQILTELRAFRAEMMRPTIEITVGKPQDKEL